MTCAYDEIYLDDAMRNLGEAFEYAVCACRLGADEFLQLFAASGFADGFGSGSPRLVSGLSGTELVMEILAKAGVMSSFPEPLTAYDFPPEYWCGWILAYFQWKTGRSFLQISRSLSMKEVLKLYPILHEAYEDRCVGAFNAVIRRKGAVQADAAE